MVLYFLESDWTEYSVWAYTRVKDLVEEAAAEAAKPLLIELAGVKAENKELRRTGHNLLIKTLIGLGGLVAGMTAGMLLAR